jgi:hypothetical protein
MRCHACYGSGKILGGGMISQPCPSCDETGWIDIDRKEYEEQEYLKQSPSQPEIIIKRSRKRLLPESD